MLLGLKVKTVQSVVSNYIAKGTDFKESNGQNLQPKPYTKKCIAKNTIFFYCYPLPFLILCWSKPTAIVWNSLILLFKDIQIESQTCFCHDAGTLSWSFKNWLFHLQKFKIVSGYFFCWWQKITGTNIGILQECK